MEAPRAPAYFQNFWNAFLLLQDLNPGSATGVVAKSRAGRCCPRFRETGDYRKGCRQVMDRAVGVRPMASSRSAAHHRMVGVVAGCCFPCRNVTSTSGGPLSPPAFTHCQGGSGHPFYVPLACPSAHEGGSDEQMCDAPASPHKCLLQLVRYGTCLGLSPSFSPCPLPPCAYWTHFPNKPHPGLLISQESACGASQSEP